MIKFKIIACSIIATVVLSCSNNKTDNISRDNIILQGHEYKIWMRVDTITLYTDTAYKYTQYAHLYFDDRQNCIFGRFGRDKTFIEYDAPDVIVDPVWSLEGDTIFIRGFPNLITYTSKNLDTVYLKSIEINKIRCLIDIGIPPKNLKN
jgi:hypothetical protein